jgi:hypothetical protein
LLCCARHNDAATYYIFYYSDFSVIDSAARKLLSRLEAAIGIEPMNKGFAVLIRQFHPAASRLLPSYSIDAKPD